MPSLYPLRDLPVLPREPVAFRARSCPGGPPSVDDGPDRSPAGPAITPQSPREPPEHPVPETHRVNLIGRGSASLGVAAALLAVWAGFEVHDEPVKVPASRAIRVTAAPPETGSAIEYVDGYEAGLRRAAAERRPLLVIFRASWCHWCGEFSRGALVDRQLVGLSRQFVCVMVDADRHAVECRRLGVSRFPTVVLASPEGLECRRWTGCPAAADIVAAMTEVLPVTPSRMAGLPAAPAETVR